ncbi:substrate-binding periplasmic protein [Oceanospirillum beijerinckii]|uniref:substrate-binding periplasmic protein n=1 Tax=Oceanospirillum beijerinckii TaxID=64976 RepID=UPI000481922E|nr:transporter substrate-binding domain-containing protein [Oceanospirillum beijerinckii]
MPIRASLSAVVLLAFSTFGFADEVKVMRFCYENQDYRPYLIKAEDNSIEQGQAGMLTDLVIEASRSIGITPVFVHYPWKRCIALLEAGQVDGIYAAIWLKKRERWGAFPMLDGKPDSRYLLWQVKYNIYSLKNSSLSWDGEQFTGLKTGIAAPLGYVAEEKLEALNVKVAHSYMPSEGMRLVALGRLDGYVVESAIGDHLVLSTQEAQYVRSLDKPFMLADWYLPLSHQWVARNPELSQRFWQALAKVRTELGQHLFQRYSLLPKS